jgi:hypothetical protein
LIYLLLHTHVEEIGAASQNLPLDDLELVNARMLLLRWWTSVCDNTKVVHMAWCR